MIPARESDCNPQLHQADQSCTQEVSHLNYIVRPQTFCFCTATKILGAICARTESF